MSLKAEKVSGQQFILGEGPVWNPARQCLFFTDITGGHIYSWNPESKSLDAYPMGGMAGCFSFFTADRMIAGVKDTIVELDLNTRKKTVCCKIPMEKEMRFNDGRLDKKNRFWVGTMSMNTPRPAKGKFYCIDYTNGAYKIWEAGRTVPNGIGWTKDDKIMYHVETDEATIYQYQFDLEAGKISNKKPAVIVPPELGHPDGIALDQDGTIWAAMWGGHQVVQFAPDTGTVLERVEVAAENVTSCAFGGQDGNMMYITTAKDDRGNGGELYQVLVKKR